MRPSAELSNETRRLLALAWPVILTALNWTVLHVTDVIVVGLTGTDQVAALGASRTLTYITIVVALGWLSGVLVFASRADGAGDAAGTGKVLHQGLAVGLVIGLASGLTLWLWADPLLRLVGVETHLVPAAAGVVRIMAIAYPFQTVSLATSFFLEGVSRPRRVTLVNLAVLPFNAVLAWAWSGGHWGLPEWGAAGAAAATTMASVVGAVAMLVAAWTLPDAGTRSVRDWACFWSGETWTGVRRLLAFGAVPALASGLELAGFSVLIALSTQLGDTTTHAFQIVFSVHNLTFAAAMCLASAAGVRVGNAMGEGVPQQGAHRAAIAALLSAGITGTCAVLLMAFAPWVVGAFPATAAVHGEARWMLLLWAPFILFDGLQAVFVYALRSFGDQVVAGVNSILAYFVVTGGLGLGLVHAGWGTEGLVLASGGGMVVAAVLHGGRLWWISKRRQD
jgi:MATE family multidrug resistance protein